MEKENLSVGQTAVIDGFLRNYSPAEQYEAETCVLFDTQTIITSLDNMCSFSENDLADYLASKGYIFHIEESDSISGWVLKAKRQS